MLAYAYNVVKQVYQILDHYDLMYSSFDSNFKSAWRQFKSHQFFWEYNNDSIESIL